MDYQFLTTRRDGAVEYLTLNRPEVRNALNEALVVELTRWADEVANAARLGAVRAVVLAGAGKVFSAGADLSWMSKMTRYTEAENVRDAEAASRMFGAIDTLPVPVIARIHGAALGGGSGLAAVCDIVVAEEQAVFGFTEVKLGIMPAIIAPYSLAKIGRSAARELFLTGARFSAARAHEIGLVHAVVPLAELDTTVARYVQDVLGAGPEAIAAAKGLIPRVWHHTIEDARGLTARAIAERRVSAEGQEGMKAFLEKRKPSWSQPPPATKDTKDRKESR